MYIYAVFSEQTRNSVLSTILLFVYEWSSSYESISEVDSTGGTPHASFDVCQEYARSPRATLVRPSGGSGVRCSAPYAGVAVSRLFLFCFRSSLYGGVVIVCSMVAGSNRRVMYIFMYMILELIFCDRFIVGRSLCLL